MIPADGVAVTGADWFAVAVDAGMRSRLGRGHTCHLVLTLDGVATPEDVEAAWGDGPLAAVASLSLRRVHPFAVARWVPTGRRLRVRGHRLPVPGTLDRDLLPELDTTLEAPMRVDLVPGEADTRVVVSWHHALLDARGAELLVGWLGGREATLCAPEPPAEGSWWSRLLRARQARNWLFLTSWPAFAVVRQGPVRGRTPAYRHWTLTEAESATVMARVRDLGAGPFVQPVFAAAAARALARTEGLDAWATQDVLVPCPRDERRRGARGPIVGNRLGVVLYRWSPGELTSLPIAVASAVRQLKGVVRDRLPVAYRQLLSWCRHLPVWALHGLVGGPSLGRVATFGLSWTGDGLGGIEQLLGLPMTSAVHYPSNAHPPGFTVVVSSFRQRLTVCTAWVPGTFDEPAYDVFRRHLAEDLLGASG